MAPAFRFCLSNSTLTQAIPIRYPFFCLSHIIVTPTRGLTVLGDGQLTVLLKGRFLRIIAHSIVSVGRPGSRYHDSRHSCAVAGVRTANDSHRLLCSGGIRLAWQMMAQRVGEHQIAILPRENRQM